jgi:hypothetical protein
MILELPKSHQSRPCRRNETDITWPNLPHPPPHFFRADNQVTQLLLRRGIALKSILDDLRERHERFIAAKEVPQSRQLVLSLGISSFQKITKRYGPALHIAWYCPVCL